MKVNKNNSKTIKIITTIPVFISIVFFIASIIVLKTEKFAYSNPLDFLYLFPITLIILLSSVFVFLRFKIAAVITSVFYIITLISINGIWIIIFCILGFFLSVTAFIFLLDINKKEKINLSDEDIWGENENEK